MIFQEGASHIGINNESQGICKKNMRELQDRQAQERRARDLFESEA